MPEDTNPYQSPQSIQPRESWWSVLKHRLRHWWTYQEPDFPNGDALLYSGIVFFVDPQQPEVLFAATPSVDKTRQRLNLVVAETVRILPKFLEEYPQVESCLTGRQLKIRLINDYQTYNEDFSVEHEFEWDILKDFLSDSNDESAAKSNERE